MFTAFLSALIHIIYQLIYQYSAENVITSLQRAKDNHKVIPFYDEIYAPIFSSA